MVGLFKNGRTAMIKKNIIAVLCIMNLCLISCSLMQSVLDWNRSSIKKQVNYFLKKNGNAFYLSSTYTSFLIVWSYNNQKEIEIHRFRRDKPIIKRSYPIKEWINYKDIQLKDIEEEIYTKCAIQLDGDFFGFRVDVDGKTYSEEYSVGISCLKTGDFKSVFLKRIVYDINKYKMWEAQY